MINPRKHEVDHTINKVWEDRRAAVHNKWFLDPNDCCFRAQEKKKNCNVTFVVWNAVIASTNGPGRLASEPVPLRCLGCNASRSGPSSWLWFRTSYGHQVLLKKSRIRKATLTLRGQRKSKKSVRSPGKSACTFHQWCSPEGSRSTPLFYFSFLLRCLHLVKRAFEKTKMQKRIGKSSNYSITIIKYTMLVSCLSYTLSFVCFHLTENDLILMGISRPEEEVWFPEGYFFRKGWTCKKTSEFNNDSIRIVDQLNNTLRKDPEYASVYGIHFTPNWTGSYFCQLFKNGRVCRSEQLMTINVVCEWKPRKVDIETIFIFFQVKVAPA